MITLTVRDPDGYVVVEKTQKNNRPAGEPVTIPFTVDAPRLWSPAAPNLYTVTARVACDSLSDEVTVRTGFRRIAASGRGLLVNGDTVRLHGVALYHDRASVANAFTAADYDEDLAFVHDVGANAVHSVSGPHDQYLYDLSTCNPLGIVNPNGFNDDLTYKADDFQTMTMGTGPYMYQGDFDGSVYTFVRNPYYWGETPEADTFKIKVIPDNDAKVLALRSGEIDAITGAARLSADAYTELSADSSFGTAINDEPTLTNYIGFNMAKEPFDDKNVRLAVEYAIDRDSISNDVFQGTMTPADTLFSESKPYCDVEATVYSYDPDKAAQLLDEAGWVMNESTGIREKDGQQLSLNYTYWTDLSLAQDMALAIKTQLAEVGIDVTTTGQDQMTWWTEGVAGNYDITTWNTEGSYTEPHKFLQESLGADPHAISLQALEDFQSYSDAVNAFSTSADPEVVQSAIATALNVSNDNVIDLPISYSKDLVVYNSSKIAGYTFSSVPQFFEIDNVQPAE